MASDASAFGWGSTLTSSALLEVSDYWSPEEVCWDIVVKEAIALERVLFSFRGQIENTRVYAMVDNQAVVGVWTNLSSIALRLSLSL